MFLRYRPATPSDLPFCAKAIRDDEAYSAAEKADLIELWRDLIARRACCANVIEATDCPDLNGGVVFFSLVVFITDDFHRSLLLGPSLAVGPRFLRAARGGNRVYLDSDEIRRCNSAGGVVQLTLHSGSPFAIHNTASGDDVVGQMTDWCYFAWSGYRTKDLLLEVYDERQRGWAIASGLHVRREDTSLAGSGRALLGIGPEEAAAAEGTIAARCIRYRAPRFCFRPAQQLVLTNAYNGETDDEIASRVALATVTVKKHWQAMYERVQDVDPYFFTGTNEKAPREQGQKRRRLLAYVRHHTEELRPVDPGGADRSRW